LKIKSVGSGNGNYIRKNVEENKDEELKYFDEKNIFEVILIFYKELSEIYKNYCDNWDVKNSKKINELLLTIGTSCFNFYYGEDCCSDFKIIIEKTNILFKNKKIDRNDELFNRFEKSLSFLKNNQIFKQSFSNENSEKTEKSEKSSFVNLNSKNQFNYDILEKIIKNKNKENYIELSFEDDYKIIEHIEFLINNPKIHSIFHYLFIPSNLESIFCFASSDKMRVFCY
jgi:hypothetical protein